jgi:hypothetical protein
MRTTCKSEFGTAADIHFSVPPMSLPGRDHSFTESCDTSGKVKLFAGIVEHIPNRTQEAEKESEVNQAMEARLGFKGPGFTV